MNKPHKHAVLIKAWADSAEIEYQNDYGKWCFISDPSWHINIIYRIKPEPSDIEKYGVEVGDIWENGNKKSLYVIHKITTAGVKYALNQKDGPEILVIGPKDELIFRRGVVNKL